MQTMISLLCLPAPAVADGGMVAAVFFPCLAVLLLRYLLGGKGSDDAAWFDANGLSGQ